MIDQLENFMNSFTDLNSSWWPVLFLRPAKDKDIDNVILLKLSVVWGLLIAIAWSISLVATMGVLTFSTFLYFVFKAWLIFFIIYKVTFAYFWNRRARRLRGG